MSCQNRQLNQITIKNGHNPLYEKVQKGTVVSRSNSSPKICSKNVAVVVKKYLLTQNIASNSNPLISKINIVL